MMLGAGLAILAVQQKQSARLQERTVAGSPDAEAVTRAAAHDAPIPQASAPLPAASDVVAGFSFAPHRRFRRLNGGGGYQSHDVVAVGDVTADGRDDLVADSHEVGSARKELLGTALAEIGSGRDSPT